MKAYALLILNLIISAFQSLQGQAPEPTGAGRLVLAISVPEPTSNLNADQIEKLNLSLTSLLTNNGITSGSVMGNLVLVPSLRIINERTINPGLQSITAVESEMSLTIKQADNSAIFSTVTKPLRGSGRTRAIAVNNLLGQIRDDDPVLATFLEKGKQKALAYYNRECSHILSRATQLTRTNQFAPAFAMLLSVPQGTTCYDQVQTQTTATFRLYQQQTCHQRLLQARARLAARDFDGGLTFVSLIDPQSPCATEARQLIEQAARETSGDNQRRWDVLKSAFVDYRNLEQYRLHVMSEVLNDFYRTSPLYR